MPGAGMSSGAYQQLSQIGVTQIKSTREKERKDMQDLNERFASYIEKVRFLEAQNRKLAGELENLRSKWGKETAAVKAMFQSELAEVRANRDEVEKEKSALELKVNNLEEQIEELRAKLDQMTEARAEDKERIEKQIQQLADYEAEVNQLRRRIEVLEADRDRDKKEIARLTDALNKARIDLDNETLAHIDAEHRRQTLEEELEFLKAIHEQEMKELAALAYRDTTAENREFWKNELGNALREIQSTYDEKLDIMKGELETYYNLKIQEFRTGATRQNMETVHAKEEAKKLRTLLADLRGRVADLEARRDELERLLAQMREDRDREVGELTTQNQELHAEIAKLRAEMEAVLKELQDLMDTKLGLELEIAAYRKLLEGEENRIGLKQIVDTWVSGGGHVEQSEDSSLKVSQVVKGEISARTTYQRSAKGPLSITECDSGGKFLALENTGRREEPAGNWKIVRIVDGQEKVNVALPGDFKIAPGKKVRICAKGKAQKPDDVELGIDTFHIGANITTKLVNAAGEDRATHVQKTIYTS